jgi:NADH-quinone oxidoreductase subunit I
MGGIVGKPVPRPQRSASTETFLPSIIAGIGVTMKHFFKNTKELAFSQRNDPVLESFDEGVTTISYPEQKRPYAERYRGLHRLTLRDDGAPRCVACLCCSTACPAQCIHIVSGDYGTTDASKKGYEKYPVEFVIDELRCIFCGFCVEACPCDAIRMDTGQHPVPYDSRDQFIYRRDLMMSFSDSNGKQLSENPRHEPAKGFEITREKGH